MPNQRIAGWIFILILAAGVLLQQGTNAYGQSNDGQPQAEFLLPSAWLGPAELNIGELSVDEINRVMPPFELAARDGAFQILHVADDTASTMRILNRTGAQASPGLEHLSFGWTVEPDLLSEWANDVLVLSWAARTYSPAAEPVLYIETGADDQIERRSSTSDSLTWQRYEVASQAPAGVDAVEIGFNWAPVEAGSWVELQDIRLKVIPADAYAGELSPTAMPTPTPYVVTSTPTPDDVLAAATRAANATAVILAEGPSTATPVNMMTATFTPTPTPTVPPLVITNTPQPGNGATATAQVARATAIAFTTGTPTPFPPSALVQTATPTATPKGKATSTATPIFILLDNLQPTAMPTATPVFPAELIGKILFKSYARGNERRIDYLVMNPDGTDVAILTSNFFYVQAEAQDAISPDQQKEVMALREQVIDQRGKFQIFVDNAEYDTLKPITFFGAGTAWAPVWSPTGERVAFVSNESRNDEIWVVTPGEWPAQQLTKNEWEWDHHPTFSPDGTEILFSSNRSGQRQLWIMDADGGNQRPFIEFPFEAWDPVWVK